MMTSQRTGLWIVDDVTGLQNLDFIMRKKKKKRRESPN